MTCSRYERHILLDLVMLVCFLFSMTEKIGISSEDYCYSIEEHCFSMGENTIGIQHWAGKCCGDSSQPKAIIDR